MVEWNVAEHPDGPDGHLASMKLRALTPDGIRMAIAKEYGLSNYREVVTQDMFISPCMDLVQLDAHTLVLPLCGVLCDVTRSHPSGDAALMHAVSQSQHVLLCCRV